MNRNWRAGLGKFALVIALGGVTIPCWESMVSAQIMPDETLGAERSVVTPDNIKGIESDRISGGAVRGSNLFHSFREFNISEGRGGYFENPAVIENIFSRVTGSNPSNILGTLGVLGNANLFFLNPNGILFGPNASLDLRGSFLGTTADSIVFPDGKEFSATNPEAAPLLTVNVQQPIGLEFQGRGTRARIENKSTAPAGEDLLENPLSGLRVPDGQSLLLVGGDIVIDGGGLHAPGGQVELAGVAGDGTVGLNVDGNNLNLSFPEDLARADISLTNEAFVNSSGESGGSIQVQGANVTLSDRSFVFADTLGSQNGDGIVVRASQLSLEGGSRITAEVIQGATGDAGGLTITTGQLILRDGVVLSTSTRGSGAGGSLTVNASESVQLIRSGLFSPTSSVTTDVTTDVTGDAGDINITTRQLILRDGAVVSTGVGNSSGAGGNLTINASESVQLIRSGMFSGSGTDPRFPRGTGDAGDLTITTGQLILRDGTLVSTGTESSGVGGNLTVNASESVQLIDSGLVSGAGDEPRFASETSETGDAGDLTITTRQLILRDRALVSTGTETSGAGGSLTATANTLEVTDGGRLRTTTSSSSDAGDINLAVEESITLAGEDSGIFANTESGSSGNGGSIVIDPNTIIIRDGAQIAVNSDGSGVSGDINLQAGSLTQNKGTITAETASNQGGNINLTLSDLLTLRNNSKITATAGINQAEGNGGNITINTPFIVSFPVENNDITANASFGNGGRVEITSQGIFGIEPRDEVTDLSDITASSEFGQPGEVEINPSAVDPTRGLNNLPQEVEEAEVAQNCQETGSQSTLEFFNIGRGGLPPTPDDLFSSEIVIAEWIPLDLAEDQTFNKSSSQEEFTTITLLQLSCHSK